MKCSKCKREAVRMNMEYHPNEWLCAFHSNKEIKQGRINKRLNKKAEK